MSGKLIVMEGLDGSGKTTQLKLLEENLRQDGKQVRTLSFPDYQNPSSTLVKMYLDGAFGDSAYDTGAYAASVFYAADRYASYRQFWQRDYENGVLFLSNRYTQSNIIHQMTKLDRSKWKEYIRWLYDLEFVKMGIPQPDMVIFLDMAPDLSQKLLMRRYHGEEEKRDIHEKDVDYLKRCRETGLYAAERLGWKVISCQEGQEVLPVEKIAARIYTAVKECLEKQEDLGKKEEWTEKCGK